MSKNDNIKKKVNFNMYLEILVGLTQCFTHVTQHILHYAPRANRATLQRTATATA